MCLLVFLAELKCTHTQTDHILTNLRHLERKVKLKKLEHTSEHKQKRSSLTLSQCVCVVVSAYLCDPADLAFVSGAIAGSRQRALFNRAPTVEGNIRGGAQVKWIVGVVVQLVGIRQALLTGCQDLASLHSEHIFNGVVGIKEHLLLQGNVTKMQQ